MVLNNWWKSSLLNFITSILPNVFCVCLFDFLCIEKLKSHCKHVLYCSHHSFNDVTWPVFVSWTTILQHQNIIKKLMTIFLFNYFFEETKNSFNFYQLRIDLNFLVLHKHLFCFCNSYIYVSWINNTLVTRSIGMKFNFLDTVVRNSLHVLHLLRMYWVTCFGIIYCQFLSKKESDNI